MPRFLDRLLDLAPAADPRRVAVGRTEQSARHTMRETAGADLLIGDDAESRLALIWAVRNGIPWRRGARLERAGGRLTVEQLLEPRRR